MTAEPYDHTEREVIAAIEEAQRRHAMLPLLIGIVLAVGLGAVGAYFSVANARTSVAASKADVERNAALTRQLTQLTQQLAQSQSEDAASAVAFRNDSRRLQLAICDQIEAVARQARLRVPPCPRVPAPSPAPTPSPPS